ncbi:MAG TPA: 50S ribosomal protein L22 [Synergistaceae bacterium]|jgi:large subunit ribosomal protein L22|nr:50S ribosomal protein L22 [Synergistaceae bacterium]HQF90947.1 50S ribosomal protein L22 [Synergistaceae bacterium]HQH78582.1 50S ribosomal protein L22 [Synergistaceae bacterium]HQK24257.1 50S ribosomal protein L22 [Synergistaceae bacterium]
MDKIREAHAMAKQVRISPNKARQVLRLIAGKNANDAVMTLRYTPKKAARFIEKILNSAVANADHNFGMDVDKLVVVKAVADTGTTLRRFRPVSMGRAHPFRHYTCHITVAVAER